MLSNVCLAHIAISIFSLSRETMDFAVDTSTLTMGRFKVPLLCDKKIILIYFDFKTFYFSTLLNTDSTNPKKWQALNIIVHIITFFIFHNRGEEAKVAD